MEYIKLTESEKKELISIHKSLKDLKQGDRIKAILLLNDGYSGKEVSKILLIDEDTITNWKERFFRRKNIRDWLKDNYPGYYGKLTEEESKEIEKYVEVKIITDSKEVRDFVKENFGKKYSNSGIINVLHNLGFAYKQTKLIPSKYNEEEQIKFKEEYEELEKNLPENEVILFTDGVHPQHNTVNTRAWIKIGKEKIIKSNTGRRRINIIGTYNPHTQEIIYIDRNTINSQSTIELFQKTEDYYSTKEVIYIISDNAKYYRSKIVKEYLKKSRIKLIFLPSYSPNLNLIERLWKFLRKEVINSKYYENFEDFRNALLGFLENSGKYVSELKKFIGTKLHLLNPMVT